MRFLMLNWRDPKNPLAGGAERVTLAYLAALVERGHEVFWYTNEFPGALAEETISGIRIIRGGGKGTSIFKAIKWYRRQKPFDLVMDQHHGLAWFAPWWCRTNCVAYLHEVLGPIWDTFYKWPISTAGRTQDRWTHWLYRNVPFWTACESTRDDLQRHSVRNISIIRYGVATQAMPVLDSKPIVQPLRLAVASRLAPNKRVDHCIATLAALRDRGIIAQLTIVGGGETLAALKQQAVELRLGDSVRFTGLLPEEDKDAILRNAHLLLHTSIREGWGLNVVEANCNGTPAAVYPVAGLRESTLHDKTGLVASRETPEALADQIIGLIGDDARYQRYRVAAWERAKTMHWSFILPKACDWFEARARGEKAAPEMIP
ncbi:MAG: glycosyltransferase family 4 protein [Verrucomicrobia bacterium]|nr:glycosyltransferase family 4 protein [Verrucomicrobiota bacterium]